MFASTKSLMPSTSVRSNLPASNASRVNSPEGVSAGGGGISQRNVSRDWGRVLASEWGDQSGYTPGSAILILSPTVGNNLRRSSIRAGLPCVCSSSVSCPVRAEEAVAIFKVSTSILDS